MTREIIFWAMNILGGMMGGRESAKLFRAAQKAGERCCQVELLVSILIEVMLRYMWSARPSELQLLRVYNAEWCRFGEIS